MLFCSLESMGFVDL